MMRFRRLKIVSLIFLGCLYLLCCAACKDNKELKSDYADKDASLSNVTEDEIKKGKYSIFNSQTNTAFTVNTEREGILSTQMGDIASSSLFFNNKKYHYPLLTNALSTSDWSINGDTAEDSLFIILQETPYSNLFISAGNDIDININNCCSAVETAGYAAEHVINEITLYANHDTRKQFWILPGGITSQSTAKNVLEIYGDPNKTKQFSKSSYSTVRELFYIDNKTSGISYCFQFNDDGTIDRVKLSITEEKINTPYVYSNEYFSVEMPGYWRDQVIVESISERNYNFLFVEGGRLFSLYLTDEQRPFWNYEPEIIIGELKRNNTTYEMVYDIATDEQAPEDYWEEFHAISDGFSLNFLVDRIHPLPGDEFSKISYEDYIGVYTIESSDNAGFELEILDTFLSTIEFRYGFYSQMRVNEIERESVVLSQGKGFFKTIDGWDYPCEGYLRLADGAIYISITAEMQDNGRSSLVTDGERKLTKYAPKGAATQYEGGAPEDIVIGPDVTKYLGWYVTDLENTYGSSYQVDDNNLLSYNKQDILFELKWGSRGDMSEQYISGIYIKGHYDLGDGIFSDMTLSEIVSVFGGTDFPSFAGETYYLDVAKNGYGYSYTWKKGYDEKSDYVYIWKP